MEPPVVRQTQTVQGPLPLSKEGQGPVPIVEVSVGQKLRAAVVGLPGGDRVVLGAFGGTIDARTAVPLELGRSYDFTVTSTEPHITLGTARPVGLPAFSGAAQAGVLGGEGAAVPAWVALASKLGSNADAPLPESMRQLSGGPPDAATLADLHRALGHDQEARVLRLDRAAPSPAQVIELKETVKARFLQFLESPVAEAESTADRVRVERFLADLSGIERDNVARAEQGAPQWWPLPAAGALRDARLFVRPDADSDSGGAESAPFTAVLLLDFTKLGAVRVDVSVRAGAVRGVFTAERTHAVRALVEGLRDLEGALEGAGLRVSSLSVQPAPENRLPIADLMCVDLDADEGLVDYRA